MSKSLSMKSRQHLEHHVEKLHLATQLYLNDVALGSATGDSNQFLAQVIYQFHNLNVFLTDHKPLLDDIFGCALVDDSVDNSDSEEEPVVQ